MFTDTSKKHLLPDSFHHHALLLTPAGLNGFTTIKLLWGIHTESEYNFWLEYKASEKMRILMHTDANDANSRQSPELKI